MLSLVKCRGQRVAYGLLLKHRSFEMSQRNETSSNSHIFIPLPSPPPDSSSTDPLLIARPFRVSGNPSSVDPVALRSIDLNSGAAFAPPLPSYSPPPPPPLPSSPPPLPSYSPPPLPPLPESSPPPSPTAPLLSYSLPHSPPLPKLPPSPHHLSKPPPDLGKFVPSQFQITDFECNASRGPPAKEVVIGKQDSQATSVKRTDFVIDTNPSDIYIDIGMSKSRNSKLLQRQCRHPASKDGTIAKSLRRQLLSPGHLSRSHYRMGHTTNKVPVTPEVVYLLA